uniref:Uncharacterized protein n=1 Tax=Utricularia reniformis TaxID=192314 RepID=A0A1Y0B3B8_9LAMI|nr:hypothetical protein AEK19_MT1771 [Utricularia reniformis]ART31945.1 hypothetical protein AEK19_MT1771 [Utricularia reniformis]
MKHGAAGAKRCSRHSYYVGCYYTTRFEFIVANSLFRIKPIVFSSASRFLSFIHSLKYSSETVSFFPILKSMNNSSLTWERSDVGACPGDREPSSRPHPYSPRHSRHTFDISISVFIELKLSFCLFSGSQQANGTIEFDSNETGPLALPTNLSGFGANERIEGLCAPI